MTVTAGAFSDPRRVLQPATDLGVALQVVVGVALVTFGALGIRAAHGGLRAHDSIVTPRPKA